MKKMFLLVLSSFIITIIYAQNDNAGNRYTVSGGLLGAVNLSDFRITENNHDNIDYDTKAGWGLGAWVNFPLGRRATRVSLEPQLMFNSYRYFTNTQTALITDGSIRFVSVPILLKLHAGDKFAFTLGPQFDFMTAVKNNTGSTAQESDFEQTSVGGSVGIEIIPHGRITLFGRYIHGFTDMNADEGPTATEYKNQNIQLGLKLKLFGGKQTTYQATTPPLPPAPIDSDGDGIPDDQDKCPNIAGTAKYEGCPIPDSDGDGINDELDKCPNQPGVAKYDGCPIPDSDGDGINDEEDQCPNVAGVAKYNGCPIPDRDNDGINDEEDKCPDLAGTRANDGCPEVPADVSKLLNTSSQKVTFTAGNARLTTTANTSLNRIVEILKQYPEMKLRIEGHADNMEKDSEDVSEDRAKAVEAYLVSKGIDDDRIETAGFGSSMPIADNNTAAGRAKNRRVELKIFY